MEDNNESRMSDVSLLTHQDPGVERKLQVDLHMDISREQRSEEVDTYLH